MKLARFDVSLTYRFLGRTYSWMPHRVINKRSDWFQWGVFTLEIVNTKSGYKPPAFDYEGLEDETEKTWQGVGLRLVHASGGQRAPVAQDREQAESGDARSALHRGVAVPPAPAERPTVRYGRRSTDRIADYNGNASNIA